MTAYNIIHWHVRVICMFDCHLPPYQLFLPLEQWTFMIRSEIPELPLYPCLVVMATLMAANHVKGGFHGNQYMIFPK